MTKQEIETAAAKVIEMASKTAESEDELMIVGQDERGDWVSKYFEDPESEALTNRIAVTAYSVDLA